MKPLTGTDNKTMEKEAVIKVPLPSYQKLSTKKNQNPTTTKKVMTTMRKIYDFFEPCFIIMLAIYTLHLNYELNLMQEKFVSVSNILMNYTTNLDEMLQIMKLNSEGVRKLGDPQIITPKMRENDNFIDDEDEENDDDNFKSDLSSYEDDDDLDYDDEYGRYLESADEADENDGESRKRKREIRELEVPNEDTKGLPEDGETKFARKSMERTSSERPSTEYYSSEKSSEYTSRERFIPATNKMSRKSHSHRKHRKPMRFGSAERFFTETHSTTSTPIQVRRSRTKATQSHETPDRKTWLRSQMVQQHTSPMRDTITKEEAVLKGYGKYLEEVKYDMETKSDPPSYNMITIHFSADTSHYSRERDPHYFGNGRMQIKSEVYKDWKPAHWTQGVGMSKYFHLNQGRVTVSTTGIYLIYAQIQYSNVQEVNGFSVFRNNESVVQCITTSTHPDKHEIKSNTCGISTTILLQSNDSVCIKDLHHGRYVVLTPEKSYFGLVLLSPFKN
ncbi:hypothetical protein RUM43_012510 [Polyplax serrata]|uniref:THD domain-containing protein n=1 Tax=Polyplax serrata TaxID=468196 RepID=A0AAN8PTT8_POLSC